MHPIVTPDWLDAHLADPDVIVLDATLPPVGVTPVVDTHARYLDRHIPGAVFFDIEALSDHDTSLPHMLAAPEVFARQMAALGVSDGAHLVVYEQEGVFSAPRARWMLRTYGVQRVSVLDGGLRAWIAAGHPTESGPVQRPPAPFRASLNAGAVKDYAAIQRLLAEQAQVVDARSAARFQGTAPEPRAGLRAGHMPGAISLPFVDLVEGGRLKTAESLRGVFAAKGIDIAQPVTTTCGSGVTAAVLALGLEIAGATDVTLYDGSWAEYASQPGAAIETSA